MSLINNKIDSCVLVVIYIFLTGSGEICMLYFSLKYFILLITLQTEALILAFLIANTIFLFGSKVYNFICYGTAPSRCTYALTALISGVLSIIFCVVNHFNSLDILALIFGNILIFTFLTIEFEYSFKRKVSNISITV